jgi:MoxR-like ATPase
METHSKSNTLEGSQMSASVLDVVFLTPGPRGRIGLPAIFWGAPGISKTAQMEQVAARHGLHLETIILSIREPSDVGGMPVVSPTGVHLEPPGWAKRLASGKGNGGACFLDELSTAAPSLQGAALRIIAEGVCGDFVLPPNVRMVAAANPEDLAAGGWGLSPPMANRLLHLEFDVPTAEAWGRWLVGDGRVDEGPVPVLDPAAWDREWAASRASFAAFIRRFPGRLLEVPKTDAERGKAWGSPRSWEIAARAHAGARALKAGDGVMLRLVQGAVGEGAANEAFAWLRALDLPDPEEVLAGHAKVPTKRADQTFASLAGVCAVAIQARGDRPQRMVRAFEVAGDVAATSADVAVACARTLVNEHLKECFRDAALSKRLLRVLAKGGPLESVATHMRG